FVRTQGAEQTNLIAEQTADHPHARTSYEPARLGQLNKPTTFSRPDFSDDSIRNARWLLAIHYEAADTCRPSCIPPATNHPHKQIAGKQRRCAYDLATTTADLLAQPRTVNLKAVKPEAMQSEAFTK